MYYLFIENNKISGCGQCECLNIDVQNVEVSEEVYNTYLEHNNYYIWDGEEIITNPNYEQEEAVKEEERINKLTMTALDFIGVLEGFGLDYVTQIKPFLESNPELDKQLKYCQSVWCGVAKQIFTEPITLDNVTITSNMVELAFQIKNGEVGNGNTVQEE